MRDLNECTAEVFRRGEKRIRERRKNRIRVLAVCIPICLIAAIWSVMSLPAMIPLKEAYDRTHAPGAAVGNAGMDQSCPYTAVEIQDAGLFPEEHNGKVTDSAAVAEMFCAIHSLFSTRDGDNQNLIENFPALEEDEHRDLTESPGKSRGYTIAFTADDSSQAVYYLSGNTLVDVNTKETISLSDTQAAGLMAALGISE